MQFFKFGGAQYCGYLLLIFLLVFMLVLIMIKWIKGIANFIYILLRKMKYGGKLLYGFKNSCQRIMSPQYPK